LVERDVSVLVYSMHCDAEHITAALSAGALGYVTKSEMRDVLIEGIHHVCSGNRFVSPKAAVALADRMKESTGPDPLKTLSGKEQEVFRRLGEGDGTLEIAAGMHISTHTVESYYSRIQLKLGIQGMYELRHRAIEFLRRHSG
jgi:DNA-binding NarL/FixJ family response regulator